MERALGVWVSRWALLAKPCMFWEQDRATTVMKAAFILQKMIVEGRRDGYQSERHEFPDEYVKKGHVLDENGEQKKFNWLRREDFLAMDSVVNEDEL